MVKVFFATWLLCLLGFFFVKIGMGAFDLACSQIVGIATISFMLLTLHVQLVPVDKFLKAEERIASSIEKLQPDNVDRVVELLRALSTKAKGKQKL